jgi:dienelactone hydrolase
MLVLTCGICAGGVQTWDYARLEFVPGGVHCYGGMTVYTFVHTEGV